ncbi:hypothetical protein BFT35_00990 [Thermoanaerobacterium thermosaccharolyticum]|uniref:BREX-1 system adenine-specific DNA-methyltransferase PglX n=1 Tax=Thermoanaerobacterium thermosaccharolyticum TaxID=1517 RepID=UPI000C08CAEF|nr:BREX-1 system adenine-specific DNA-methyltransferase PglX [Thermoanaerobacterium thermosaccharolyticum]PHO08505.1 hypothetical protein BFT35_00990 [Thermoanaerobacterium thermosaccharolyticum]
MNKNAIKNYAVWARNQLKKDIEFKAYSYEITKDSIEDVKKLNDAVLLNGKLYSDDVYDKRNKLIERIREVGDFDQVIEEIAYTWFNRFIALRYMEVNGYLPTGVRVLSSSEEGRWEPDIVYNALTVDLPVDKKKVLEYKEKNNIEELYRYLLIIQCNELNRILPFMFEEINDYTELLLPDNLLKEGSVIRRLVSDIDEADFKEGVEIIGWLYQFYVSEKHEKVVGINKGTIKKEDIPAATQLFTPEWIVKYMVDNSLGKLWIEGKNDKNLKDKLTFYLNRCIDIDSLDNKNNDFSGLKPENIKILDPACGSGHILVYAFEVLYDIYLNYGYMKSEIPALIIENNLYGLDIDDRAAQLASFSVVMKAREKNRLFFKYIEKYGLEVNIVSIKETNSLIRTDDAKKILLQGVKDTEYAVNQINNLLDIFNDAKLYGSILEIRDVDFDFWQERLDYINSNIGNMIDYDYSKLVELRKILPDIVKQAHIMSMKYDVVVTNPPYMGKDKMEAKLKEYVIKNYKDYNSDLFSIFIYKNLKYTKENGFAGFMSPFVWMFIKSYEKLREYLIDFKTISSLIQLEYGAFEEATVPICTYVIKNCKDENYKGDYIRLSDFKGAENQPIKVIEAIENPRVSYRYNVDQSTFKSIPGSPIAYWVSDKMREAFVKGKRLGDIADDIASGNKTANNQKYLRYIWEVNRYKIDSKWILYAKGGEYRKWYGNIDSVIDWSSDARYFYKTNKSSNLLDKKFWFKKGITYTDLTSKDFNCRILTENVLFDMSGPSIIVGDEVKRNYLLGFYNSIVNSNFLKILNSSFHVKLNDLMRVPIIYIKDINILYKINKLVNQNISISKTDWDSFETSWDFEEHPFLKYRNGADTIEEAYNNWADFAEKQFYKQKANEEELNRIFIDIYGLQDELTPDVDDNDVTVRKADLVRDVKSFISYAVGCMFGRYSLDKKGLVYAGGEFDIDEYKTYKADEDGIIPITDSEYFQDDIVSKFIDFVRTVFGSNTLSQNLEFIANAIGRNDNETAADAIRRYFLNGFYKDHTSIYQKRPIYWLFTSGKEKAFNALIYIHRYDKDTLAKMRTDYLHMLINKVSSEVNRLNSLIASDIPRDEKRRYEKLLDKLNKQLQEMGKYDELLRHYAERGIEIDLDDGVKINYTKFDGLLANIR